ncbi:MAG: flagellar M-ring protein FliF [Bdellovibrionales bacterium]|nr:flagellar M-ring protein FliF [Bdellovibrionales bacterium]
MEDYIKKMATQIGEFFTNLSPGRKLAMTATAVVIFAGISAMFFWAGDTSYQSLMTNLNAEDSANIIRILREKKIPFKVDPTGKNVSVPPDAIYQLRLELATMGLPQTSVVGYEVFDKQSLGQSTFVQKLNQKRALEGELMRSINQISGVKRSRVHLAIPQKAAFVEDQKKSSASVVLDLDPGTQLSEKQIYGIGNLVSRAVEGLDIVDVAIMDGMGKVLSKNPNDPLAAATASQHDFRAKVEKDFEHKIESVLARIVGDGRVVARVSADIDFSQTNETQTSYDGDGSAIRSVQRDQKSMEGSRPGPYGLAGAASNTPGTPPAANAQVKTDTKTTNETTNYEIPQSVKRIVRPAWEIRKLSVAVVVDGKTVRVPASALANASADAASAAGADGKSSQTPVNTAKTEAWSPEKLKEFEAIVASSVGIDRKRGDVLEVKNMEFSREDFEEATRLIAENERKTYVQNLVTYAIIGLTIVLFFLLVVRPFIKWFTDNTVESVDSFLPQTIEELEKLQKNQVIQQIEDSVPVVPERVDPDKVEGEMLKEKITTLIDSNPHKAALVLKDWMHGNIDKRGGAPDPGKGKTA